MYTGLGNRYITEQKMKFPLRMSSANVTKSAEDILTGQLFFCAMYSKRYNRSNNISTRIYNNIHTYIYIYIYKYVCIYILIIQL